MILSASLAMIASHSLAMCESHLCCSYVNDSIIEGNARNASWANDVSWSTQCRLNALRRSSEPTTSFWTTSFS